MTSTPVPAIISYGKNEKLPVKIISKSSGKVSKKLTIENFIRSYCFTAKEQGEITRSRFADDLRADIFIQSDFLKRGAVLIDTLGISATEADTLKNDFLINSFLDLVIYVAADNVIKMNEIDSIRDWMGFRSFEEIKNKMPRKLPRVSPEKFIFLANEKLPIIKDGFKNRVESIFYSPDCNWSENKIKEYLSEHIFFANALYGRLLTAGSYPYIKYVPSGSVPQAYAEAEKLERKEYKFKLTFESNAEEQWNAFIRQINNYMSFHLL